MYDIPSSLSRNGGMMGSSTRLDRARSSDNPPPIVNPSAGPGTYEVDLSYKQSRKEGYSQKFNMAPRKGMALSSESPGPVYELGHAYKYGVDKRYPISFNKDKRRPISTFGTETRNADFLVVRKKRNNKGITIARRLDDEDNELSLKSTVPGPIYSPQRDFKTGPSFSFGRSKAKRFR